MAEAITNDRLGERWQAFSAGTKPTGDIHPLALQVLSEMGIEHQARSKSVEEMRSMEFDLVVTVCDSAAEECPVWLGAGKRVHLGFPEPAKVEGGEAERLRAFRQVRDDIAREIPELLGSYS